ncbi:MAG TPA: 16S rRNA (cytosine(967)-C(5))-methyltransferase RsmB [bacterium]|nr:16S rRNA (cytosine(967)-C(5))-methyltransferase RsmB [bacterium]
MDRRRTAREVALEVLHRVDADRAWTGPALRAALNRADLAPADEAFATELVYGTLRHRAQVDWALGQALHRRLDSLPPRIREVLRLGAYQLAFLSRVPARAACDETVELARRVGHRGTVSLVNAVMRRLAASPPAWPAPADTAEAIAVRWSHPEWLVARWLARFGPEEARALCASDNETPPSWVRLNTLRGPIHELDARVRALGLETLASERLPEARRITAGAGEARERAHAAGLVTPQDEGSMLVARLVAPQPGETVIDACAAPGGKTTHLAALMENRGRVLAFDVLPQKLETVTRQCARLGVTCVEPAVLDAATLGERYRAAADRVLVDAPCSGLGVLRRRPEIRWRVRAGDLAAVAERQRRLLAGAAGAVRPGGRLVYSVCTIEPEEGPEVVAGFLAARPEFEPAPIEDWPFAVPGAPGTAFLYPHHAGTDGFFVAALRRAS